MRRISALPNTALPFGERKGPTPIGLYNFGVSYLDTARSAMQSNCKIAFSDPIEHLFAHGVELIFKADLMRNDTLDNVRQRFGHDLVGLRYAITSEFVLRWRIDAEFDDIVRYLDLGHSGRGYRHRYLQPGFRQGVSLSTIGAATARFNDQDRTGLVQLFGGVIA